MNLRRNEHIFGKINDDRLNVLGGAIVASQAEERPEVVLNGALSKMLSHLGRHDPFRNDSEISQFVEGWFAAAPDSFSRDAEKLFRRILTAKSRENLKGLPKLLSGFEAMRLGSLAYLLRKSPEKIEDITRNVNDFSWQSARMLILTNFRQRKKIGLVNAESLAKIVIDPWAGSAVYKASWGVPAFSQISVGEWTYYADCLALRDSELAKYVLLNTVGGETPLRTSISSFQGLKPRGAPWRLSESDMYPFRAYAVKKLMEIAPETVTEMFDYGVTEKCPVYMRSVVFSAAALRPHDVDVGRLKQWIDSTDSINDYVMGLALGLIAVNGAEVAESTLRSADEDTIWGYSDVAWFGTDETVGDSARRAREYHSMRLSYRSDIDGHNLSIYTPWHLVDEKQMRALFNELLADEKRKSSFDVESCLESRRSLWPTPPSPSGIHGSVDETRLHVVDNNSKVIRKTNSSKIPKRWEAFALNRNLENAIIALSIIPSHVEPAMMIEALDIVSAEAHVDERAMEAVEEFVEKAISGVDSNLTSDMDPTFVKQWRSDLLSKALPSLIALEKRITSLSVKQLFNQNVIDDIREFMDGDPGKH